MATAQLLFFITKSKTFAFLLVLTILSRSAHGSDSLSSAQMTFPITGTTYLKSSSGDDFDLPVSSASRSILNIDESHGTTTTTETESKDNVYAQNSDIVVPENSHVEFSGHTIGDSHRSSKSSQSFFASVDLDGDGQILKPELSYFLSKIIGGSAFDDDKEIEDEVGSIMNKMDLEGDGKLEMGDVNSYWEKLESLLTVDEVAEWIVHAGQLPMEIGNIFRKNHVTGYDFPELVEDNGSALKNELNIDKSTYRKKIIRAVNSRLFGIGTVPFSIEGFVPTIESCSTVSLKWNKARTDNLPVHKYRVMRRAIGGGNAKHHMGMHVKKSASGVKKSLPTIPSPETNNDDANNHDIDLDIFQSEVIVQSSSKAVANPSQESCEWPNQTFDFDTITQSLSEWTTVYDGSETECIDSGLNPGQGYIYRIQAWNLVGKSPWTVLDISDEWLKKGCYHVNKVSKYASVAADGIDVSNRSNKAYNATRGDKEKTTSSLRKLYLIVTSWGKVIINVIMTIAALSTALMRLRRATVTSTATSLEPLVPWIFRKLDEFMKKHIGFSIIPESFMMESHERLQHHDNVVKSVGLNGYIASKPVSSERAIGDRNKHLRDLRQFKSEPSLNANLDTPVGRVSNSKSNKKPRPFSRIRSPKVVNETKDGILQRSDSFRLDSVGIPPVSSGENSSFDAPDPFDAKNVARRGRLFRITPSAKDEAREATTSENVTSVRDMGRDILFKPDEKQYLVKSFSRESIDKQPVLSERSNIDDHNYCNSCLKKCKFPKRCRHHCSKCGSTFCHKHGKTTHNNLVTCKVPGDCICNICLGEM